MLNSNQRLIPAIIGISVALIAISLMWIYSINFTFQLLPLTITILSIILFFTALRLKYDFTSSDSQLKTLPRNPPITDEFTSAFESASIGMGLVSLEGKFLRVNKSLCDLLGYTEKEFMNLTFQEITHPDDLDRDLGFVGKLINDEIKNYQIEKRYFTKNGEIIWINLSGSKVKNPDGSFKHFIAQIENITPRKKAFAKIGEQNIRIQNILESTNASKAFLDTVLNSVNVGIVVCDQNGKLTVFNQAATDMHGIPFSPIESDSWSSYYNLMKLDGVNLLERDEVPLYRALKEGNIFNSEFIIQHQSGNQIIVNCTGNQIWDQNENLLGAVVAMNDITKLKLAKKTTEEIALKFKGIFDSTFQFIGFLSPDGTLLEANQTAINFAGLDASDLIGKKFWDCYWWTISRETQETLKSNIEKAAKGEFVQYEVEVLGKMGPTTILFNLKPLFDAYGEVVAIIPEGRPIQEIVDARKALLQKNEELERFASVASHDLKEPLRMISTFLSLFQKNYGSQLDEKAKKYIHYSVDAATRMTTLINDLLNYAKIGDEDVPFLPINTNKLLDELLPLFAASLEEKKGTIEIGNLPDIYGKVTPIKTLFQNLIGNALKYHKPTSSPLVKITGKENSEDYEFCVADNGIGISSQYFEEIFQMFRRLHTKEEYSGTGMGLATCSKIVNQHGGEIWVESEEGQGSKFFFTIKKQHLN